MDAGGEPSAAPASPGAPSRAELESLAAALPRHIKFGTSSWPTDGWAGDVYHRTYHGKQPTARLEEYVRYPLFRMVGVNTAFYEAPDEAILVAYARILPPGYACDVKVWDRITARRFIRHRRWGALAGQLNPDFLNGRRLRDTVLPRYARAFARQELCFLFQFQAMRGPDLPSAVEWAERLDPFLAQLPKHFRYAVELRNAELLTPLHGEVLKRHGVAHVFNSWTEMPSIGAQLEFPWSLSADFIVARGLLKPGRSYAQAVKLFQPYDRVREPDPELRRDLLALMKHAVAHGHDARIHINNRAEGNAPGTMRALTAAFIDSTGATEPPPA